MNDVHFVCDEAAILKQMPQIQDALNVGRGFGLHLTLFYQSCPQLKECFPDGQDGNVLANVTQVMFGVNDLPSSEYVSARLGEETQIVESGGTSRGSSWQSGSRDGSGSETRSLNCNDNWNQGGRKLLFPAEVMALSPRIAITFAPGVPPICTRLIRYYEEQRESVVQRTTKGLRAVVYAAALLWASLFVATRVAENYQYRLDHPPARAVPRWQFR